MTCLSHLIMNFVKQVFIAVSLFVLLGAPLTYAGFGVTPPYVRNTSLTRNSTYEQQILLVRGDPTVPLKATVIIDAPGIEDWIEIVEGTEFPLPRGEQKVPMTVRIKVPEDADFRYYEGAIRVKTGAADDAVASGAVNISLGAQIDIQLDVIDKEIKDFSVRKIGISDLNAGHKVAWLYFPGKIRFNMLLENTGNVDVSPSKVSFRIFDPTGNVLLEDVRNKGKIKKIAPYATEQVTAELPTRLPAGPYLARFTIYNGDEIKQEGEVNVNILPYGTLQVAGFGFLGLSLAHQISVLLPILALLSITIFTIYTLKERRLRRRTQ
jgi:hypothetical protein